MLKRSLICLLVAGSPSVAADAQTSSGAVHGTVRDQQGGAVADATVDIRCGKVRTRVRTTASGAFQAPGLPSARCQVEVRSEGFEPARTVADAATVGDTNVVLRVQSFASRVVVTPARGIEESAFEVPDTTSVTSRGDIDARPYTLFAQVLREEPGILLQQTTSAQVSPIIRGFTGQSNIYLLDGVRLNTGSWRSGPNQYLGWVDGGPVNRIEVVRGGGSVQYGSDALGGTVQMLSAPTIPGVVTARYNGNIEFTAASADQSVGAQGDLGIQRRSLLLRVGATRRTVNDLRAGGGLDSHNAVTRFLGLPSTILGSRQIATDYDMGGAYGVADIGAGGDATLHALYMHTGQSGASRYDRVLGGAGVYASGFDPQTLDFGLVRYQRPTVAGFDGVSATLSFNRQGDGRFEQSRPTARLDRQQSTTTAVGYQAQAFRSFASRHLLTVGGEFYDESIDGSRELIEANGAITASRPDIPDGTSYSNLGVFAQQTLELVPDRLTFRGGIRYSRFAFGTTPNEILGVPRESVTTQTMTFQTGAVFSFTPDLNVTANVTRGFRAPNASDLGGIGLSGGGGFQVTPSKAAALGAFVGTTGGTDALSTGERVPSLQSEVVYQYEAGVRARVGRLSLSGSLFDMELYDFIQRRALVFSTNVVGTSISGFEIASQDPSGLAYIAQDVRPIATSVNTDRGRINGVEVEGELRVGSAWTTQAYFSTATGKELPGGDFSRRMPPPLGGARVRWAAGRTWVEGVLTYALEQTRLNSGDLSDARIGGVRTKSSIAGFFNGTASDMGLVKNGILIETGETLAQVQKRVLGTASSLPLFTSQAGFAVVGVRGGLRVTPRLNLTVIAENVGDSNYRLYGSGIDAPGFNLQVRTHYRF